MPATQRDARVRVEYRDAYRNRVQIYVSPKEAKVLHDTHAASYKPRSEREMNLRAGLSITRDNFGLIELDEVRFSRKTRARCWSASTNAACNSS
ncbi:MAG: hypothetical protein U0Y68_20900 [Blastocatellia bacterium]